MSVLKIKRQTKTVYRVHWREGGHHRTRSFDRKHDAVLYDAEVKRRKQLGDLATLTASRQTLAEFAEEWFQLYAIPNLQRATRESYACIWDAHILKRLGGYRLNELTPETITRFRADLERAGVGPASVRPSLVLLQGVLERAIEWRRITSNPARPVKKPSQRRKRVIRPLAPSAVEAMRGYLLEKKRHRDTTLISVLAYAGLRPGEALALTWNHIQDHTILVEHAVAYGELKTTKTGRQRTVRLLTPLKQDLAEWRLASGRPADHQLVFPGRDGNPWTDDAWRAWRRKVFQPAAEAACHPDATPYHLRHSYISLLIHEGANIVDIARQAGHSPVITLTTYAHVIDELPPGRRRTAESEILRGRANSGSTAPQLPSDHSQSSRERTPSVATLAR